MKTKTLGLDEAELAYLKWVLCWDGKTPMPLEHLAALSRLRLPHQP